MSGKSNRREFLTRAAAAGMAVTSGAARAVRAAGPDRWGDLVGGFIYDGDPPERKRLTVDKDVECCGRFDIRDESLMVGEEKGIANIFVYVRSRRVEISPELEKTVNNQVLLDNRDCIFMPHCMTIWYDKQEFYILNSDPVAQNVAFNPLGDVPANIVIPVDGDATCKFRRRQTIPVLIRCNYHPWESAYVLPRDNPYATVTGMDGKFRIAKLPVGKLEFQVWHERVGYLDTPQWPKGRFELEIKPEVNELPTLKLPPSMFEK